MRASSWSDQKRRQAAKKMFAVKCQEFTGKLSTPTQAQSDHSHQCEHSVCSHQGSGTPDLINKNTIKESSTTVGLKQFVFALCFVTVEL